MSKRRMLERRLKALASGRRLQILKELKTRRGATVSVLAGVLNLSMATTSRHLAILSAVDIVRSTRRGKHVSYRLALHQEAPVKHILSLL